MEKRYTAPKTTKPSRASPLTVTSTQPALVKKPSRVRECEKRNGRDDSISEGNISLNESLDSESILKVRQQKDAAELLALKRENESLMEKLNLVEQEKKKLQDNENKLNFKIKALEIEKQEAKADLIKSKGVLQIVQTSNGSLMQEIEKLKSVISAAKGCSDVEQLKKEKEELVKKIEGLKSDVDNLKGVKCSVEMEHLRLKTSVQDLRQQKDTVSKDLSELKAELEKIRASSKSSSPRDAKDEIESIRLLTVSFKNEIARLEKENSQLKEKMKEVENQKKEASEEIEKISKQLDNSKEAISQKQKEIQDLGQQMSIMMKKEDADKLLKERDELKLRNEKLKKELEDLKKHKVAIQTELLYLKEKVQELEKQKEEANAGLIKAKSVSQIVQVNNQNLIQELEKLKQVKSPTSGSAAGFIGWGEVEKLKQERDDLVHKILNLKKDTDDIKKERNSLESERMQLKEKIEELEQRKEEVSVDLGRMKIEFERLQMSNSQSLQEIEKSFQLSAMMPREEVEELYREKGDIRDDTESLRILTSCLENEKSKLEIENCHLKEKVEQLEQLKEETSVEIEKTVSQLEGSKARLVQNEQEIQSLNAQILGMVNREEAEKLRKERDCLNKTIEGLKKDTSMIQEQKESLKVKIVDLEGKVEKLEKQKEDLRSVYVAECEKAFGLLNVNESAIIKKDEFVEIIKECAIIQSEEEILRLFNEIDNEGNNEITLAGFLKVVCNEESGSKYTHFIESVIRKAEEIISLKNKKATPQIQLLTSSTPEPTLNLANDGWVERQTEVEIKNKEVQKPLKAKAFFMNRNLDDLDTSAKQEESSQLYLMTSPTASSFSLGQEKMMRSYTPTYMNGGITFQNHLDKSAVALTSQTPKDGVEQNRGRIPRLFGGDQDKAKRAPGNRSEQPRQIQKPIYVERGHRLEKGVDQFLKALGNSNTVDPELKEELKMCVKDLPNKELDKMANLARPERIAFLSLVIGQFKDSKTNGNKYSAKIEHLEQILEKERNQLKTEQGEIRKLRIMGLVGLSPFVQNFSSPTAGGRGGRPQNK